MPGRNIAADQAGAAIVEFAIAVPILTFFIYGIFAVGRLYEANAGIQHALGEGARYATLCLNPTSTGCTVPTDDQIRTKISSKLFGLADSSGWSTPTITTDAAAKTKTITVTYSETPDFLFIRGPRITLSRSKVVYYSV
jgi:Flp pilus assembly protein TadG